MEKIECKIQEQNKCVLNSPLHIEFSETELTDVHKNPEEWMTELLSTYSVKTKKHELQY